MWRLVQESRQGPVSRAVTLVSSDARLVDRVAPVVAGAGLELTVVAAVESGSCTSPAEEGVVLWDAGLATQPPAEAVVVGADETLLWERAARLPGHRAVVLPQGRAWLSQHLGGVAASWWSARRGRLMVVSGVGESACPDRVAVLIALAAQRAGLGAVLVDVHGKGGIAAVTGAWVSDSPRAGWEEAVSSVRDGSPHGLIAALPLLCGARVRGKPSDGIPVLSGGVHTTCVDERGQVLEGLLHGCDVVIAVLGSVDPSRWWDTSEELGEVPGEAEHVVAIGAEPLPAPAPHRLGVQVPDLITVRGLGRAPDGPDAAAAIGTGWAGTVDVRRTRPNLSTARLLRRHWAPRLAAGQRLGRSA